MKQKKKLAIAGADLEDASTYWENFLDASVIPEGYRNAGLHYGGYIADSINDWCLPSWIWVNAALVRMYCRKGNIVEALIISDILLKQQLECGGWIVRNDYSAQGAIPTIAPNDSAYIANNALLEIYKRTNRKEYLDAARKCADWIIETARPDGLVWSGYDVKHRKWIEKDIIVDTGFTAALFANLYEITNESRYRLFLQRFVCRFIELFYSSSKNGFATSLDMHNARAGGMFARGQAWALEGLIPAYRVLRANEIKRVIDSTISNLIGKQLKNGGWAYNFSRPLLGEDCKGVAVIGKVLNDWNKAEENENVTIVVQKSLDWCARHTANESVCKGGIFSFCMEGAVVHNFYTKTAFIYSSAYALEMYETLRS